MGDTEERELKEDICHLLDSAEYKLDDLVDYYAKVAGGVKLEARKMFKRDSFETADDFADCFDEVEFFALRQSAARLMCEGIHKLIKLIKDL